MFLKIAQYSEEKIVLESLFNKAASLKVSFAVNVAKFFRTGVS